MNVRNLLADAFDSAASRIRNNSCGMTDQEMESALHKMLYLLDSDHHFNEDNARATIARMYYLTTRTSVMHRSSPMRIYVQLTTRCSRPCPTITISGTFVLPSTSCTQTTSKHSAHGFTTAADCYRSLANSHAAFYLTRTPTTHLIKFGGM